jgi:Protein of unknown function (DUF2423)
MGKSVRSKQQRINRSNRRNLIHKPNEDSRLERLLEKGKVQNLITLAVDVPSPVTDGDEDMTATADPTAVANPQKILTQKEKRDLILNRNQKKKKLRKTRTVKVSKNAKKFE